MKALSERFPVVSLASVVRAVGAVHHLEQSRVAKLSALAKFHNSLITYRQVGIHRRPFRHNRRTADTGSRMARSIECHLRHRRSQETARFIDAFLASDMKVSALGSVRLGKISKDDDYDR